MGAWRVGERIFLEPHYLLQRGERLATIFGRPGDARPAIGALAAEPLTDETAAFRAFGRSLARRHVGPYPASCIGAKRGEGRGLPMRRGGVHQAVFIQVERAASRDWWLAPPNSPSSAFRRYVQ